MICNDLQQITTNCNKSQRIMTVLQFIAICCNLLQLAVAIVIQILFFAAIVTVSLYACYFQTVWR